MRLVSTYNPELRQTKKLLRVLSELPSTDFWKKIPQKLTSIFTKSHKFPKGIVWRKKFDELATLKFWNKIECTHPV